MGTTFTQQGDRNARPKRSDQSPRTRLIVGIKAAERKLGMDKEAHRLMVFNLTGKDSLTKCDSGYLKAILTHLNKLTGYKRVEADGAERRLDTSPEASKLRALWLLLHRLGAVRNPSEVALAAYVKRIAKVDDLHWAREKIEPLIEGLKAWAARELPAALEQRLRQMQAAGLVDPRNTVDRLLAHAAPTRRRDSFDALHAAWEFLNEIEAGNDTAGR